MMIGIHAARRDGVGMDCDVSLFDVAMGMLTYLATWHLSAGYEPARTRHSAHPSLVPFQNFETLDGWIVVGCAKQKFWERLCHTMGRPELLEDERFADFRRRHENREILLPILEEVFRGDTSRSWLEKLGRAKVPCSGVNRVAEAFREPQAEARNLVVETAHPHFGTIRQVASPVRVGSHPPEHRPAPARNAEADYVLREILEYPEDRIRELAAAGAFG